MIRTNENTMLTREEYKELAEKVGMKIADKLPDNVNPFMVISTAIDVTLALKFMEEELFGEEEK
jgi:hypothetical protein